MSTTHSRRITTHSRPSARALASLAALIAALPLTAHAQTVIPGTTTNNTNATSFTVSAANSSYILNAGTTYQLRSATDSFGIRLNAANVTFSLQGTLVTEAPLSTDSDAAALRITGASTSGINVQVGSATNTDALILSKGNDAVKFTGVGVSAANPNTLTNFGTIRSEGRVNTSGGASSTYIASDAITMGVNTTLTNNGTISGARHGIDGGAITGVVINNNLGGTIIGRNGSGIGADTTSANPGDYVINNRGLIRGDYAGAGNIFDRANAATLNGDGDGIDIDGAATIRNYATGQILSTGAGGFDSGSRANNSEAISIGGGIIENDGLIRGSDRAIVVNNDSVANRSGSSATTITNNAGGIIEGQNGFAIRLENKTGTAADNDTIINAGTIIGTGTIPDPSAIVNLQNGTPDTNSTGTLNGVSYTGTGSARFIRGDGAAIQMGEGNDTLTNTGTIIGTTGRAVSLEGGNDTLNYTAGSITGSLDGGVGTDTLNLGASVSHGYGVENFEQFNVSTGKATISGAISGTSLTKGGNGTLVLSGANTYTGPTTITAGSLLVNNLSGSATGTGNVFIDAGASLGGSGFIAGNITLSGSIAPGNSIGTLSTGGNVTWNGTAANAWAFELGAGNTSDRFNIGGSFLKGTGSDFLFDFLGSSFIGDFLLIDWDGRTTFDASDFKFTNLGAGLDGTFAFNGSQLEFTSFAATGSAVPEPSTYALFGTAALGLVIGLRRRTQKRALQAKI
ncbi:MAG: autotransporter-associated beta strand repeat-containing protein [Nibricoccus sp.]